MKRFRYSMTPWATLLVACLWLSLWNEGREGRAEMQPRQAECVTSSSPADGFGRELFHPFTGSLLTSEPVQRLADTRPSRLHVSHGSASWRSVGRAVLTWVQPLKYGFPCRGGTMRCGWCTGSPRRYYVIALRRILR